MVTKVDYLEFKVCVHPFIHAGDVLEVQEVMMSLFGGMFTVRPNLDKGFEQMLRQRYGKDANATVHLSLDALPFLAKVIPQESVDISTVNEILNNGSRENTTEN